MGVSEEFYNNLLANSTDAKRLTSLERLRTACDALEKQPKASAYSVADVGRHCERQWGGPKAQSIRNARDVLEKYVKLRIAEHTEKLGPRAGSHPSGRRLLNLADPAVAQQQFQLALAEIDQLRAEVARLKVDVQNYAPLTPDQLVSLAKGDETTGRGPAQVVPPADVLSAIDALLDPQRLRGCELVVDAHGYLVNEVTGNELLSAGAILALRRFADVSQLSDESQVAICSG